MTGTGKRLMFVAVAIGICLMAVPAMATIVYYESFDTGMGIWADAGKYTWQSTGGDPGGYAWVNTIHRQGSAYDANWDYWWSRPTGATFACSGNEVTLSYDFYKASGWTVYPQLMVSVHFTDETEEWLLLTPSPISVGWNSYSITQQYAKEVSEIGIYQMNASVYSTASVYVDNLVIGFDNIKIEIVPEPMTLGLLALGGAGVLLRRRRK